MMSPGELAAILRAAAAKAETELEVPTKELMLLTAEAAREMIGHYQIGWAQLAPSTVEEKTRLGYAPPDNPLLRTAEFRESIKGDAEPTPFGAEGVVGSNDPKAKFHEMGTSKMAPRMTMGLAMHGIQPLAEKLYGEYAVKLITGRAR